MICQRFTPLAERKNKKKKKKGNQKVKLLPVFDLTFKDFNSLMKAELKEDNLKRYMFASDKWPHQLRRANLGVENNNLDINRFVDMITHKSK